MKTRQLMALALCLGLVLANLGATALAQDAVSATPGQDVKMMLLPKFLGILPFDQANQGAEEAAAELQNPTALDFDGPTAKTALPDRSSS